MRDLTVSVIQTELIWENIELNLELFDKKIDNIQEQTDLIILPEMFTTGFTMNARVLAQGMNGHSVKWLMGKSREKNAHIVGSMIIYEDNKCFNRLVWSNTRGELFTYDKRHLFRMSGEDKVYSRGNKNITINVYGWNVRPFICYDLRFPVWLRNIGNEYDIAIFIANWPQNRSLHWKTLLQARAIENQCYVVGVNRVGQDGNGISYSGDSSIIDFTGNILFQRSHEVCIYTTRLVYKALENYRESFPAWMDVDSDLIKFY